MILGFTYSIDCTWIVKQARIDALVVVTYLVGSAVWINFTFDCSKNMEFGGIFFLKKNNNTYAFGILSQDFLSIPVGNSTVVCG